MSDNDDGIQPAKRNAGFLWTELKTLIDTLLDLHTHISSRLLVSRVNSSGSSGTAEDGADSVSLRKSYDRNATMPEDSPESPQTMPGGASEKSGESIEAGVAIEPMGDASPHPNELSEYLRDHDVDREFEHPLSRRFRDDTMDRVNRALGLAKQGDKEGAYTNAGLAENAMRLAGEYMTEVEYEAFRKDMERRLESVIGRR